MGRFDEAWTGRRMVRSPCPSCGMRFKVGEPKAQDTWPAQLSLNPRQLDLLLVAAAEFEELCEDAQIVTNAVDFVDWIRVDALSPSFASPIRSEASPPPSKKVVGSAGRREA